MEELIRILLKWWKPIAIASILAAMGSAIVSFTLPEVYLSHVTFLTANPHIFDRNSLFRTEVGENPVYLFGGGNDMNRVLTLAESRGLENYLIDKYKLYEHYKIEENNPQKEFYVKEKLRENCKVLKTSKGMLRIEVQDKEPVFAAEMANDVLSRLDVLNKEIIMEKKSDMIKIYEQNVKERKDNLALLKDSLINMIKRDPEDTVNINMMESMVETAYGKYSSLNTIYEEHQAGLNQNFSTMYIIESAVPAVKRHKPVRSIIVMTGTLLTLLIMCFAAVFIEKFKDFNVTAES